MADLLMTALWAVCFVVTPLFAPKGYYLLGEYKAIAWLSSSGVIVIMLSLYRIRQLIQRRSGYYSNPEAYKAAEERYRGEGWTGGRYTGSFCAGAAGYLGCILVSAFAAIDRRTAFLGEYGWRTGFLMELILILLLFVLVISGENMISFRPYLYGGAVLVIIPAVLQRFGIELFPFMREGAGLFVSTVGQINWYCGYLSIIVPFAAGELFLSAAGIIPPGAMESSHSANIRPVLSGVFLFVSVFSALTQGSNSAFLYLGGMLAVLCIMVIRNGGAAERRAAILTVFICLSSALTLGMIIRFAPAKLTDVFYSEATYAAAVVKSPWTAVVWAVSAAYLIRDLCAKHFQRSAKSGTFSSPKENAGLRIPAAVITGSIFAAAAVLLAVQIFRPSVFSDGFGSGRGIMWKTVSDVYGKLPLWRKLFGAGEDCLNLLLQNGGEAAQLHRFFGSTVMCAHSILLNRLVTTGFFGTAAYCLLIYGTVFKLLQRRDTLPYALGIMGYCLNGLVSFDQVMNLPYLFIMMGAGIRILQEAD